MTLQRILAILAAACLVGAIALATLGPPSLPLGQVLLMIDHDMTEAMHGFVGQHLSEWIWTNIVMPVLVRPAWLAPVALGLIFAGAAASVGSRKPARRPHRRPHR